MRTKSDIRIRPYTLAVVIAAVAVVMNAQPTFALDQVTITEPNHVIGYLPLYVAQRRGFFADGGFLLLQGEFAETADGFVFLESSEVVIAEVAEAMGELSEQDEGMQECVCADRQNAGPRRAGARPPRDYRWLGKYLR